MIGMLTGVVKHLHAPMVILDVNGIGYEVETPLSTFCQLQLNASATLWIHHVVREDADLLYGFIEDGDKQFFRLLLKVNGVGPKLAAAILSGMSAAMIIHSIDIQDISTLTRIPGVGKKTAERLVIELKDRISNLNQSSTALGNTNSTTFIQALSPIGEAEAALVSLGYKPLEAQKAVGLVKNDHSDTANLIRAALKQMLRT